MVRGSGKFKVRRGGGRTFSRSFTIDEDGTAVGAEKPKHEDEDEEEDEEEEGEEERGTRAYAHGTQRAQEETGCRGCNKAEGDGEGDDLLVNPNHVTKKLNISDLGAPRELTRREREQKEKHEAKDRYWKLHAQGKTDQAKADLSRLAKIRAEREAAAAKRKAEAEEKAKALEAANTAQSSKRV
ncbi:casein kinase substrate phosphoprotein PP28-domain-containing protein [Russula brevipes]|nr:casein kinase substrate phosphoprotein PP28-domain-containing protein [Russula brevipes]